MNDTFEEVYRPLSRLMISEAREAADSIKPGVERSGTPLTVDEIIQSPRSG